MVWENKIVIDKDGKTRVFEVATSLHETPPEAVIKKECTIMIDEFDAAGNSISKVDKIVSLRDNIVYNGDPDTPSYEILEQMDKLVKEGKEQW